MDGLPITLFDGNKLIEHGIGVCKRTLEVQVVEPVAFADLEGAA